ncbi:MAG: tetratricopeptide repeat protein, partial [Gammaproteobacteria bacterium]|nr:tetratricopeptide repeat protein [Gammaproteobacteria bacterium]
PQGTAIYLDIKGRILFLMGRYEEALPLVEDSAARNPALDRTQLNLAAIYAELGRTEDAEWAVNEALAINTDITLVNERRESIYRHESDLEHYVAALRTAGVPEQQ